MLEKLLGTIGYIKASRLTNSFDKDAAAVAFLIRLDRAKDRIAELEEELSGANRVINKMLVKYPHASTRVDEIVLTIKDKAL